MENTLNTLPACQQCNNRRIIIIPKGLNAQASLCPECFRVCPLCKGDGFIFERDKLGRDYAKKCPCQGLKRKISLYNNAGVPGQFYDATFENFQTKGNASLETALQTAQFSIKKYIKSDPSNSDAWKGLLFMGGVGIGKTRLVCTMVRALTLEHSIPCLFQEFSSLLSEIKSGYDKGHSESSVLEKINNIDILVVDELGKGRKSEWEITILDTIISNRYNMKKTTIFTTNYTDKPGTTYTDAGKGGMGEGKEGEKRETLEQRVYSRIYSRLKGMCNFVEMQGADHRLPSGEIIA